MKSIIQRSVAWLRVLLVASCATITAHAFTFTDNGDGTWQYTDANRSFKCIFVKPAGNGPFPGLIINHGRDGTLNWSQLRANTMSTWGAVGVVCIGPEMTHVLGGESDQDKIGLCAENTARGVACYNVLVSLGYVDTTRIAIYGHSMGGYASIGQSSTLGTAIRTNVLTSSGSNSTNPGSDFATPSLSEASASVTGWGMWVGSNDTEMVTKSDNFENILISLSLPNDRNVISGLGHNDPPTNSTVLSEMQTWLQDYGELAHGSVPSGLNASVISSSQINLSWNTVGGANGYQVLRSTSATGPFTVVYTGATNSHNDTGLSASTPYYYYVRATYTSGRLSEWSSAVTGTTSAAILSETFYSEGTLDGHIQHNDNTGANNIYINPDPGIRAGKGGATYISLRGFLSFDTSDLPDGATIVSATLKIKQSHLVGSPPSTTALTIKSGDFNGNEALEGADYSASGSALTATIATQGTNDTWVNINLTTDSVAMANINKTGNTQFRLSSSASTATTYVGWYGGEAGGAGNAPQLVIEYTP